MSGVVVNRLARTRDSRYWHEQLIANHGSLVLPPVRLRAAVAEAAAPLSAPYTPFRPAGERPRRAPSSTRSTTV